MSSCIYSMKDARLITRVKYFTFLLMFLSHCSTPAEGRRKSHRSGPGHTYSLSTQI